MPKAAPNTALDAMSEAQWQANVIDAIHKLCPGALVYHTHDSRHSAAGFPDIVALLPRKDGGYTLVAWELKRQKDKTSKARLDVQEAWLAAFRGVTDVNAGVLRPSGWDWVLAYLQYHGEGMGAPHESR